jgi:hypothetical protein
LAAACSKTETAKVDTTTPSAAPAPAPTAAASPSSDSLVLVRGSVASVSATQLIVKTDSASVTVNTPQAVHVYTRGPSDLSHVSDKTFIGVTTVRQADGSEKATEIHIFPEELRGLGEGSRPIAPAGGGATPSKMTNGAASTMTNGSASTMTNGSASTMTNGSASKMTNGAASTNGKTIVVNFAGGSTTAVVPPGTSITEIKPTDKKLAAGDQVVVVATRGADGNLMSTRVMMAK